MDSQTVQDTLLNIFVNGLDFALLKHIYIHICISARTTRFCNNHHHICSKLKENWKAGNKFAHLSALLSYHEYNRFADMICDNTQLYYYKSS